MAVRQKSITYTVVILAGILIALVGTAAALFGLGGLTALDLKFGDLELKTTSVGLTLVVIGAGLAGFVATKLPDGITPYSATSGDSWTRLASRFRTIRAVFVIVALCAALLLGVHVMTS